MRMIRQSADGSVSRFSLAQTPGTFHYDQKRPIATHRPTSFTSTHNPSQRRVLQRVLTYILHNPSRMFCNFLSFKTCGTTFHGLVRPNGSIAVQMHDHFLQCSTLTYIDCTSYIILNGYPHMLRNYKRYVSSPILLHASDRLSALIPDLHPPNIQLAT